MVTSGRERGFALLVGIFVVALVGVSVLLVLQYLQVRVDELRLEERTVTLTALTDAALAETLARLDTDPAFPGLGRRAFGRGAIASRVVATSGNGRRVAAEARFGRWRGLLEATVELGPSGPRVASWERRQGPAPGG
jgi:hypothetical protein